MVSAYRRHRYLKNKIPTHRQTLIDVDSVSEPVLCLSQTTGYAILACSCLDRCTGDWLLAKDIADCTGIPLPYLSKVLNGLSVSRIVQAKRGYRGGFKLARPGDRVSLLDVVEAVEGSEWASRCLLGLEACSDEQPCPAHASWKRGRRAIAAELKRTKLSDTAGFMLERGRQLQAKSQLPTSTSGSR